MASISLALVDRRTPVIVSCEIIKYVYQHGQVTNIYALQVQHYGDSLFLALTFQPSPHSSI